MEAIQALAGTCRVAAAHDHVLNAECCYTFHTPYTSPAGILVNLSSFTGTVPDLAMVSAESTETAAAAAAADATTQAAAFVRIVKERVLRPVAAADDAGKEAAPNKLGVGVVGGFLDDDAKYETVCKNSVVVLQKTGPGNAATVLAELPYSDATKNEFPMQVAASVDSILNHAGLAVQQDLKVWQLDQDEDVPVSKYCTELPFCDNGVVIDPNPASWKCAKSGATENLWLNLSDGYIGGGRKNWDGSGGSNGALDHFVETGNKYPLVVKLGTITMDMDTADCYSYAPDEDGPVKIPNVAQMLEKRGILVASMYVPGSLSVVNDMDRIKSNRGVAMIKWCGPVSTHFTFCCVFSFDVHLHLHRQKTAKSTAEMEVELNANYAFDAITEAGAHLQPVSGPCMQGLQNLGNSCYMNSVVQLLLSGTVTELAHRYGTAPAGSITDHALLKRVSTSDAPDDLLCQTAKVGCALTSGFFAKPEAVLLAENSDNSSPTANDPKYRLAPRMLKHVVGKDHVDFCTGQQQDAAQFLQYLLERLDRAELSAAAVLTKGDAPLNVSSHLFSFQTKSRMVCSSDKRVKYKDNAAETIWSLRVPMEKAVVKMEESGVEEAATAAPAGAPDQKRFKPEDSTDEEEKKPIPTIDFQTCVDEWAAETPVDGVRWPHLQDTVHAASERTRFTNFPRYLIVQIQRYQLGPDWAPIKLEVNLDISEEIDLAALKATGPQEGENLIPDEPEALDVPSAASAAPAIDEAAVGQLMDMGFSLNACKRALVAVGGSNVEAAMGWVFEHNEDPDFNDPLPEPTQGAPAAASGDSAGVDEGVVQSLVENLGCFSADQVRAALQETSGAADRAADWLFSHMDDLDGAIAALASKDESAPTAAPKVPLEDGKGKYKMVGLVSHIGKNTGSGHYVAHLKKDGKWIIFNDEKVALSSQPPIEHAYIYLFQRTDAMDTPNPNY